MSREERIEDGRFDHIEMFPADPNPPVLTFEPIVMSTAIELPDLTTPEGRLVAQDALMERGWPKVEIEWLPLLGLAIHWRSERFSDWERACAVVPRMVPSELVSLMLEVGP